GNNLKQLTKLLAAFHLKKRKFVINVKGFKMRSLNLEARKIAFIQEFLNIKSEKVIEQFERLLRTEKEETIEPISVEEYERKIESAMEDSKNGRMIKATELKEKVLKWS